MNWLSSAQDILDAITIATASKCFKFNCVPLFRVLGVNRYFELFILVGVNYRGKTGY